jgi:hypothetical protein
LSSQRAWTCWSARPDEARRASPLGHVHREAPPFLLLHGDADPLIPPLHSQELYEALRNAGADAQLVLLSGAVHDDPAFWEPGARGVGRRPLIPVAHAVALSRCRCQLRRRKGPVSPCSGRRDPHRPGTVDDVAKAPARDSDAWSPMHGVVDMTAGERGTHDFWPSCRYFSWLCRVRTRSYSSSIAPMNEPSRCQKAG